VTNPHGQPFVLIGVNVSGYGVKRPENRSAARAFGVLNYDMSFRHWAVPDFANGWIPDAACRQRNVMGIGRPVQLRRVGVSDRSAPGIVLWQRHRPVTVRRHTVRTLTASALDNEGLPRPQ
jgi:hypothetical protein